ncbi:MAG TPA: hypothetical protein VJB02_01545 [Coxiellaceae bacterium]|nr:hypothetical protein [Coxiellaceae bacterium]
MKKLVILIPIVATIALAGCESRTDVLERVNKQCYEFGFHPGTSDFAACVQQQYDRHEDFEGNEIY